MQKALNQIEKNVNQSSSSESETDSKIRKSGLQFKHSRQPNTPKFPTKKHPHDYAHSGYGASTASSLNSSQMSARPLSFSTLHIPRGRVNLLFLDVGF